MIYKIIYRLIFEKYPFIEKKTKEAFEAIRFITDQLDINVEKFLKEKKHLIFVKNLFEEFITTITQKSQITQTIEKEWLSQNSQINNIRNKIQMLEIMIKEKIIAFFLGNTNYETIDLFSSFFYHLQQPEISKLTDKEIAEIWLEQYNPEHLLPIKNIINKNLSIYSDMFLLNKENLILDYFTAFFVILETRPIDTVSRIFNIFLEIVKKENPKGTLVSLWQKIYSSFPQNSQKTYSEHVKNNNPEENNYRKIIINTLMSIEAFKILSYIIKETTEYSKEEIISFSYSYIGEKRTKIRENLEYWGLIVDNIFGTRHDNILEIMISAYINANLYYTVLLKKIKEQNELDYNVFIETVGNTILLEYFNTLIYYIHYIKTEKIIQKIINFPQQNGTIKETFIKYIYNLRDPSTIISQNKELKEIFKTISLKQKQYTQNTLLKNELTISPSKIMEYLVIKRVLDLSNIKLLISEPLIPTIII